MVDCLLEPTLTKAQSYIGSLFSIRGPRDTTALLDIERAFNKLEKVALSRRRTGSPPLVLIVNSTHLVRDDHDGQDLLEMIQQRAEQWSASGLVTTSRFMLARSSSSKTNSEKFSIAMTTGYMSA